MHRVRIGRRQGRIGKRRHIRRRPGQPRANITERERVARGLVQTQRLKNLHAQAGVHRTDSCRWVTLTLMVLVANLVVSFVIGYLMVAAFGTLVGTAILARNLKPLGWIIGSVMVIV